MGEGPGMMERASAFFRNHSLSMSREIDIYLSENMYDLIDKHNLATRNDLVDVEKRMAGLEGKVNDLEIWKDDFRNRLNSLGHRIELQEKKYGLKG